MNELLEFVEAHAPTLKYMFCILGEPESVMAMSQKITDNFNIPARAPNAEETIIIPIE